MHLTNPYPTKLDSADITGIKLQCDIDPRDKALLMSLRPSKGTIQLVVNNLLKNICDELRHDLNIHGWTVDGDQILAIILQRRPLSDTQRELLRCTASGITGAIPTRILDSGGGPAVREKAAKPKTKSANSKKRVARREQPTGEETSTAQTTQSEQNPSES